MAFKKQKPRGRLRTRTKRADLTSNKAITPVSYRSRRRIDSPGGMRQKPVARARLVAILIAVVVVVALELPVSSHPKIVLSGGSTAAQKDESEQYQQAVEQIISSSVANRTKLTLNKDGLTQQLLARFPAIEQAEVSYSPFSYRPRVSITLRHPVLVLNADGIYYLIDGEGNIISRVTSPQKAELPVLTDESAVGSPGERILPTSYVEYIEGLIAQLKTNGVAVSKLDIPMGTAELDLTPVGKKYFAKFNLEGDYKVQAGSYLAVSRYLGKRGVTPSKYIDLRVEGRAYYQ